MITTMTQEQKELLLKDLCARLPYKVRCKVDKINFEGELREIEISYNMARLYNIEDDESENVYVYDCKPYLFPISSMTEEQREEFLNIQSEERKILFDALVKYRYEKEDKIPIIPAPKHINWLLKNHFDIYGLIPMGLANDATDKNIY